MSTDNVVRLEPRKSSPADHKVIFERARREMLTHFRLWLMENTPTEEWVKSEIDATYDVLVAVRNLERGHHDK